MAFGTFFKKIISGVKDLAKKAVPIVQKGLATVEKFAKPISNVVDMIPGAGGIAQGIRKVGEYAGMGNQFIDKARGISRNEPQLSRGGNNQGMVGYNGSGQRRFDVPQLK